MKYTLQFSSEVRQILRAMPKAQRQPIGYRLHLLCDDLNGDVKKLKAVLPSYRLRVGGFRVLFALTKDTIKVFAVKDRKDAYE